MILPTPAIQGERAWRAADRACGADGIEGQAHYAKILEASSTWARITEEAMWEAAEILPPIYFRGGFACPAAVLHDDHGRPWYLCVVTACGKHYARYSYIHRDLADEVTA